MNRIALLTICAFVAFMPFEMMVYFEDLPSGAKMVGALMVVMCILAFLTGHRIRGIPLAMVVQMAFVTWFVSSVLWSYSAGVTFGATLRLLQFLLFVLFIWEFAVTYQEQIWLLRAYLLGLFVPLMMQYASRAGIYEMNSSDESARLSGGGHDLNYLAAMEAVSIIIAVYLATNPTKVERLLRPVYWFLVGLLSLGIFLTASRSGFLCLLAAVPFAMIVGGVSFRNVVLVVKSGLIILVIAAIGYFVVPSSLWSRSVSLLVHNPDDYADPRWEFWARSLVSGFLAHPLAGVGGGAFGSALTAITGVKTGAPHNIVLSVLTELGIVGILLYATFIALVVRAAWRLPSREKALWIGVLCVWFIMSMAVGNMGDKLGWFLHVMVLAQSAALCQPRVKRLGQPAAVSLPPAGPSLRSRFGRS